MAQTREQLLARIDGLCADGACDDLHEEDLSFVPPMDEGDSYINFRECTDEQLVELIGFAENFR